MQDTAEKTPCTWEPKHFSLGCTPEVPVLILSQFRAKVLRVHHKSFLCFYCERMGRRTPQLWSHLVLPIFLNWKNLLPLWLLSVPVQHKEVTSLRPLKVTVGNAGNHWLKPKWTKQFEGGGGFHKYSTSHNDSKEHSRHSQC